MTEAVNFTTPVGQMVQGSLYKASTTDAENRPLIIKTGPNIGKPTQQFFFALAIPKEPGHTHWSQTAWGKMIWDFGHAAWPGKQAEAPTFAWKIRDGDSAVPNKAGRKPCDHEGFRGCWVLSLTSQFAPKLFSTEQDRGCADD